ncbi:MAG: DUF971 domain-containing protein [Burkholderiaceae bacterium]
MHPQSITDHPQSRLLDIVWSDGKFQQYKHALLRSRCQCADCKTVRLHSGDEIESSADILIKEIRPVGMYGLQLIFSDGHDRGIYPWNYLRELPDGIKQ